MNNGMEKKGVIGYKVFYPDWTCRERFQYEVGKVYEMDEKPECCSNGFHFCKKLADCFNYYRFNPNNKVAKVIALGEIDEEDDDSKCCTNKIKIMKELSWEEVLKLVNTGEGNTGLGNSGNCNSGNYNSGDYNSGNCNSGDNNSGNGNSGDWNNGNWNSGNKNSGYKNSGKGNSGNRNSGDWNSGFENSGDCNSGNKNSGDFNKTNHSNGCFNMKKPKIYLFDKPSDWTYDDWLFSDARGMLCQIPKPVNWISPYDMTDAEKKQHPEYETTGGYLKELSEADLSEKRQKWWDELADECKECIKSIPNFDSEIFKEITGIDVNKEN